MLLRESHMVNNIMKHALVILLLNCSVLCSGELLKENAYKLPTVGISVLVRNKAHTLPYFLSCFYNLDYPKDRLYLWIYSDYNEDNSVEILGNWAELHAAEYSGITLTVNNASGPLHSDEKSSVHWSQEHFKHVITLREQGLEYFRKMWADFMFMVDADVFLTNPLTLKHLVSKDLDVVAPMLLSDGLYSNFWCGMSERYYYERTDEYKPIQKREILGCFSVPMIHTAVLINMRTVSSDKLTYDPAKIPHYNGPFDDIIAFAVNAEKNKIGLYICNDELYGYIPVPLEDFDELATDYEQLINLKLEAISMGTPLPLDEGLKKYVQYPRPWKFGCNEIYMINLERRPRRRNLMDMSFLELGMGVKYFKAVDGQDLDMENLREHSITLMHGYEDPYHKRPMKAGEVGCFLSHYGIWLDIVKQGHAISLILEDDIHFVPYFRNKFLELMQEIETVNWDLVYIGRKILSNQAEMVVTTHTTKPLYSYWTLGYLITQEGAAKLLDAQPLKKMLPVDEFLPIMFDQHPNANWKANFPKRNLIALSASPLLVHPTHYTGQEGYISDTEDSKLVEEEQMQSFIEVPV